MSETSPPLSAVEYGKMNARPQFQLEAISAHHFDETLSSLKRGIENENLWVLAELDVAALFARAGLKLQRARQLLYFHPRYASRIVSLAPEAMVEAPAKLWIMESPDTRVVVRCARMETVFEKYRNGLTVLGAELDMLATRLLERIQVPH